MINQNEKRCAYYNGALVTAWPNLPAKPGHIIIKNEWGEVLQVLRGNVCFCKGGKR